MAIDVIPPLSQKLMLKNTQMVTVVLDGLNSMLKNVQNVSQNPMNPAHQGIEKLLDYVAQQIEECVSLVKIEALVGFLVDLLVVVVLDLLQKYSIIRFSLVNTLLFGSLIMN